ncbi:MAG: hypothetical protein Q8R26_02120 [bacterium]|nr:hypothetical protein [bacterium]
MLIINLQRVVYKNEIAQEVTTKSYPKSTVRRNDKEIIHFNHNPKGYSQCYS